jgi:hypothetical protein
VVACCKYRIGIRWYNHNQCRQGNSNDSRPHQVLLMDEWQGEILFRVRQSPQSPERMSTKGFTRLREPGLMRQLRGGGQHQLSEGSWLSIVDCLIGAER